MKIKNLNLIGLVALFSAATMSSAIAQDVSSTPVGYVTITINGNGYTAVTNPLQNAVVYSGTASSVASDTITTSFILTADEIAATDAEGNSAYYVQTASGAIYDVTANTDSTITVSSDVSSLISADDAISVKKYTTLADIFSSDNSFGLTSGGDVASSDVVYVMSSEGAGTYAQLAARDGKYAIIKLPSGESRMILQSCLATIGSVSNPDHQNINLGKAGRSRWLGRRPNVRGVVMNPVDHPHGGGEGRTSGGRHPVTPWGVSTKGKRTRTNKRTDNLILRKRYK